MKDQFITQITDEDYPTYWEVSEMREYDRWSFNAGQSYPVILKAFGTLEDAQKEYPKAEYQAESMPLNTNNFDHLPDEEMTAYQEQSYWDNYDGRRDW
jgi:hypothetical protein